ncbi:MAG: GyrI-like domain-containing protein [Simkaniaceae bacterium]|nr:GyrI-like domain-containing protein [Candidatus Sacchlamyda saccharinae]
MEYKIIDKGPMQIMGISIRTTNENDQAVKDLPPVWDRFYSEQIPTKIPYQKSGEVLGLYCEYEKDHTKPYTFVAGFDVTVAGEIPEGLVVKHLPESKYAVFEISGQFPQQLIQTWQWIWQSDLNRTFTGDFEAYQIGFDGEKNTDIHIYIAIN